MSAHSWLRPVKGVGSQNAIVRRGSSSVRNPCSPSQNALVTGEFRSSCVRRVLREREAIQFTYSCRWPTAAAVDFQLLPVDPSRLPLHSVYQERANRLHGFRTDVQPSVCGMQDPRENPQRSFLGSLQAPSRPRTSKSTVALYFLLQSQSHSLENGQHLLTW